jgi:hypothetical protein
LSLLEKTEWQDNIGKKIGASNDWKTTPWGETTEGIKASITELPSKI